jgi:hypothetical protein
MQISEVFDLIFNNAYEYIRENHECPDAVCGALGASREAIIGEYEAVYRHTLEKFIKDKDGDLDRHKHAAAFMVACLSKLETRDLDDNPQVIKLIREDLAIKMGLGILILMVKAEGGEKNAQIIDYWENNGNKLNFPGLLCDSGDYETNWAVGLYRARQNGKLFVLSLANDLFLIESHNREFVASEMLKAENRGLKARLNPPSKPRPKVISRYPKPLS